MQQCALMHLKRARNLLEDELGFGMRKPMKKQMKKIYTTPPGKPAHPLKLVITLESNSNHDVILFQQDMHELQEKVADFLVKTKYTLDFFWRMTTNQARRNPVIFARTQTPKKIEESVYGEICNIVQHWKNEISFPIHVDLVCSNYTALYPSIHLQVVLSHPHLRISNEHAAELKRAASTSLIDTKFSIGKFSWGHSKRNRRTHVLPRRERPILFVSAKADEHLKDGIANMLHQAVESWAMQHFDSDIDVVFDVGVFQEDDRKYLRNW